MFFQSFSLVSGKDSVHLAVEKEEVVDNHQVLIVSLTDFSKAVDCVNQNLQRSASLTQFFNKNKKNYLLITCRVRNKEPKSVSSRSL